MKIVDLFSLIKLSISDDSFIMFVAITFRNGDYIDILFKFNNKEIVSSYYKIRSLGTTKDTLRSFISLENMDHELSLLKTEYNNLTVGKSITTNLEIDDSKDIDTKEICDFFIKSFEGITRFS